MTDQVNINRIREEMKSKNQWICWETGIRNGKETKLPKDPETGEFAKSDDPETWSSLMNAKTSMISEDYDGIGFMFSPNDPFVGIDLDKCRDPETGEWEEWALNIMSDLGGWIEISPSGTGGHVIIKGEIPGDKNRKGNVEMYETRRYFTVTGNLVNEEGERLDDEDETPEISANQQGLDAVYDQFIADENESANEIEVEVDLSNFDHLDEDPTASDSISSSTPTASSGKSRLKGLSKKEKDLVKKAKGAKNGYKFTQLWKGNWETIYNGVDHSHSEADMGFCDMLAFWCSGDPVMMDRIFRSSGLMRPKWDSVRYSDGSTYGERTIEKAIAQVESYYNDDHYDDLVESQSENIPEDDMEPPEEGSKKKENRNVNEKGKDNGNADNSSSSSKTSSSGNKRGDVNRSRGKEVSTVVDDIGSPSTEKTDMPENNDIDSGDDNQGGNNTENKSETSNRRRSRDGNSRSSIASQVEDPGESSQTDPKINSDNSESDGLVDGFEFEDSEGISETDENTQTDSQKKEQTVEDKADSKPKPEDNATADDITKNASGETEEEQEETDLPDKDEAESIFDKFESSDTESTDSTDPENNRTSHQNGDGATSSNQQQGRTTSNNRKYEGQNEQQNRITEKEENEDLQLVSETVERDENSYNSQKSNSDSEQNFDNTNRELSKSAGGKLEQKTSGSGNEIIDDDNYTVENLALDVKRLDEKVEETKTRLINDIEIEDDKLERIYRELIQYEKIVDRRKAQLDTMQQIFIMICKAQNEPVFDKIAEILLDMEDIPEENILDREDIIRHIERQNEEEISREQNREKQEKRERTEKTENEENTEGVRSRITNLMGGSEDQGEEIEVNDPNETDSEKENGSRRISLSDIF